MERNIEQGTRKLLVRLASLSHLPDPSRDRDLGSSTERSMLVGHYLATRSQHLVPKTVEPFMMRPPDLPWGRCSAAFPFFGPRQQSTQTPSQCANSEVRHSLGTKVENLLFVLSARRR